MVNSNLEGCRAGEAQSGRGWRLGMRLALVLCLGVASTLAQAEVTISIEPEPPREGDSFRIAFSVAGDVDEEPDFKPLEPQLEILGRNQQTSLSLINGKYTRQSTWILEVLPKAPGPIDLPALTFGDERSAPLRIEPAGTPGDSAQNEGLFLEAEATPRNPYVQQEVLYTVRLWRRYELSNASLSEPRLDTDAMVRPLGEDRQYVDERDGQRYEVVERRYLVYPQKSGRATIAPVTVTAQVLERAASLFEMFGRAIKTRRVSSPAVQLEVRPMPAAFPADAHWLPARQLRLNEVWSPDTREVRAGEPLTRTLSLWAKGLTSGQLPAVPIPEIEGVKVYPDEAQLQDTPREARMTAIRQQKVAFVGARTGTLEVPEVRLPWWNTETDRLEFAELPAHTVSVKPDPLAAPSPAPVPTALPAPAPVAEPARGGVAPSNWRTWPGWPAVSAGLALALLVTLSALWQARQTASVAEPGPSGADAAPDTARRRALREHFLAACAAGDPEACRAALLAWAAHEWPAHAPRSLGALADRMGDDAMAGALRDLEASLYGRHAQQFSGAALASAFKSWRPVTDQHARPVEALPPLFKLAS
jgi:hypothetical protein